jgi:hypothetical protein
VSVSLFASSFKVLHATEVALEINDITGAIVSDRVYTAGRYFLGLGRGFVRFPIAEQPVEYRDGGDAGELRTATADEQISVELSFTYKLMPSMLPQLFRRYAQNYRDKYVSLGESVLGQQLNRFNIEDYYARREIVSRRLRAELNRRLVNEFASEHAAERERERGERERERER